MNAAPAPTAFVSWSHDDDAWRETVLEFASALRAHGGVDADFDLWHADELSIDWAAYGPSAVWSSDFVLIAVSRGYRRRWDAADEPQAGPGATSEAAALKGVLRDRTAASKKLRVVVLPGASSADIPLELLASALYVEVPSFDATGLEGLLRNLYDRPLLARPDLSSPPRLPPGYLADFHGTDRLDESEADDANATGQSSVHSENAAERFLGEVERLVGHREPGTATLERAARVVAAEEAWREGLGLLLGKEDVARLLGIGRAQVDELANDGQIIVLDGTDGTPRYPAFQFQDGQTTPVLARAHRTLMESGYVSSWSATSWARTGHPELDLRSPAQWAGEHRDHETLLLVARRDAARAVQ